jgi:hypothetical protein
MSNKAELHLQQTQTPSFFCICCKRNLIYFKHPLLETVFCPVFIPSRKIKSWNFTRSTVSVEEDFENNEDDSCQTINSHFQIQTMTKFNFHILPYMNANSFKVMTKLLQHMPTLSNLTIETLHINIDGHQWKQIIPEHFPKLKVFRFKMRYLLDEVNSQEEEINRIVDSY